MASGLKVPRPVRRNTRLKPTSPYASETKPSSAISSVKPKCCLRKSAEAVTSRTLSESADAVIFTSLLEESGGLQRNVVRCITYKVQGYLGECHLWPLSEAVPEIPHVPSSCSGVRRG